MTDMAVPSLASMLFVLLFGVTTPLHATDIWLSGLDPFLRQAMKPGDPSDYKDLFQANSPWSKAATKTAVFKVSTQWIVHGSDELLTQMFTSLRARHIALALEALMMPRFSECGRGVEGYASPGVMAAAAERIRNLGGDLAYVAMDEPLWGGHHYTGPNACRSSLDDLAQEVATNVKAIHAVFPLAKIGDIEVISTSAGQDWIPEIMRWSAAYARATGAPLAFIHADVSWNDQSIAILHKFAKALHSKGIKFGIIYNGDPSDPTGAAWLQHAETRFDAVEAGQNLIPDHAVLQTWMLHPEHMLPEDAEGTMTHLILRYARTRSRIEGTIAGTLFKGHAVDANGAPITNSLISILQRQDGRTGELTTRTLTGIVPEKATEALVGLRVNNECWCNSNGDVGLGATNYQDNTGATATRTFTSGTTSSMTGAIFQLRAIAGQQQLINTSTFPVTPGRNFEFSTPMRSSKGASASGYVALIFLDAHKNEIRRDKLPFQESDKVIATVRTNTQGRFRFKGGPAVGKAVFRGNEQFRYAEIKFGSW